MRTRNTNTHRANEYLREELQQRVTKHMMEFSTVRANSSFITANIRELGDKEVLESKEAERRRAREALERAMAQQKETNAKQ